MAIFNALRGEWDVVPAIEGPIELYRPLEDGSDVEFFGEFNNITEAVRAIDCPGYWMISHPDRGKYTGTLDASRETVVLL